MPQNTNHSLEHSPEASLKKWLSSAGNDGYNRIVFEGGNALLPELQIFGWLSFSKALPGALEPDYHPGAFEIHYMRHGHANWWVNDEDNLYEVRSGQTFIVKPGEVHGGLEGSLQPCEHFWLRICFPSEAALPRLSLEETEKLKGAFSNIENRKMTASKDIEKLFEMLLAEHQNPSGSFASLNARALLHSLLVMIASKHHEAESTKEKFYTWRVRKAIDWINERQNESELQLEELSKNLNISVSGLRSRFRIETGYTPLEYVVNRRMKEACHYLEHTDKSITDVAFMLGSSSSQYFATTFKKYMGITPSEYRSRHRKSPQS